MAGMTLADYEGKTFTISPTAGCAKCMFFMFSCGTPFTFKVKQRDDTDSLVFVDNTFCFCLHPSPCPCLPCCGIGPCAQAPKFKRDPADPNRWLGTGESIFAGGCCTACFHNKGDVWVWSPEKSGANESTPSEFWAGNGPAYPPCLHNKHMGNAYLTKSSQAAVKNPASGGPAAVEMAR